MNKKAEKSWEQVSFVRLFWGVLFFGQRLLRFLGRLTYLPVFLLLKYSYIGLFSINVFVSSKKYRKLRFMSVQSLVKLALRRLALKVFEVTEKILKYINRLKQFFSVPSKNKGKNPKRAQKIYKFLKKSLLVIFWVSDLLVWVSKFQPTKKSKSKLKSKFREKSAFYLKVSLGIGVLCLFVGAVGFYVVVIKNLPDPDQLINRKQILSTKIYARDGSLLYKIYRNQNRTPVKLDELPQYVVDATIAVEDRNYWSHPGFSIRGIVRAMQNNFNGSQLQGGSTITQQLVKNVLLSPERTYIRKLKELVLAIQVEIMFSKQEILQMYFNEIPYGGVAYGIEEAAQTYFGKSAKDLTLPEATLLAGLPSAPTKFSPYGAQPEYAVYRQHHALKRMLEDGYISQDEYQEVLNTKIKLNPPATEIKAPHFVMYVKDQLVERYGTRMVEEGGLEVYTSLDPEIQISAEEAVASEVDNLREMKVSNGAALVTNPQTGEILAMVGSSNYFDTESDGNVNVTLQQRQPGSSIKPVTYALALLNGMTPMSMINDSPVSYPDGDKLYQPVNYDNTFHGRVSLKTALGSSFNIPAVKLVDRFGVTEMIELGKAMGITTWEDRDRFGLSITLGGGEVKMTDMAVVYGVFANQGIRVDLHPILKVQDYSGRVLEEFKCEPNRDFLPEVEAKTLLEYCSPRSVLSPYVAYQITSMLADNNARIPGFGANSLLNIENHQVAVKTGTTDGKRDNWAIGYTQNQVVVVWVGNNDNSPMSSVASGITGATPIWRNITDSLLEDENTAISFAPPSGMVPVAICADNGLLPCDSCQVIRTEYFVPGTEPKWACK